VIFSSDDFEIKICSLGQNAAERLRREAVVALGDHCHAYFHSDIPEIVA
jgi:hypothetical protein